MPASHFEVVARIFYERRAVRTMTFPESKRVELIRKLADTDQRIAAAEAQLATLHQGSAVTESRLAELRGLRRLAEKTVILLRAALS
jgi:transposase